MFDAIRYTEFLASMLKCIPIETTYQMKLRQYFRLPILDCSYVSSSTLHSNVLNHTTERNLIQL